MHHKLIQLLSVLWLGFALMAYVTSPDKPSQGILPLLAIGTLGNLIGLSLQKLDERIRRLESQSISDKVA